MSNRQCSKNRKIVPTICVENNFEKKTLILTFESNSSPFWIFGILNVNKSQRQRNQGGHDSS